MKFSSAIFAICAAPALAQDKLWRFFNGKGTPDGQSAGVNGFSSYCNQYDTKGKAFCNQFCYAQDCHLGDEATVSQDVCDATKAAFIEATGEADLPCERPCPCWDQVPAGLAYCQFTNDGVFLSISDDVFGTTSQESYVVNIFNGAQCFTGGLAGPLDKDGVPIPIGGTITAEQADNCKSIILDSYDLNDPSQCTLPVFLQRNLRH